MVGIGSNMENTVRKDKNLLEVFPHIGVTNEAKELFEKVKVLKLNFFKKAGRLEICAEADTIVDARFICAVEQKLASEFHLNDAKINISYSHSMNLKQIVDSHWKSLAYYACVKFPVCKGILTGCKYSVEGNKLTINLKTKGSSLLVKKSCDKYIETLLQEQFSVAVKVVFSDAELSVLNKEKYIEFKQVEEDKIKVNVINFQASNQDEAKKQKKSENGPSLTGSIILGRSFNDTILTMKEVTSDSGKVAICGDIFKVEFRELRGGKFLCSFDVTDYTSSLSGKFFLAKDDVELLKERVKQGVTVKLRGEAQYDKYSKELVIFINDMIEIQKEMKLDLAEFKRVELHLHSQMSAMDAVTPLKELVKRAAKWGHNAIAITDHGVVQAYPEAYEAGKKNKIKIIYGVECYLADDNVPVVYNPNGHSIDEPFVVFDIETTGLDAERNRITEIGAVKIQNGQEIERFSTFVNPGVPIPENIIKLTGITDDMVEDAPCIETILPSFLEFAEGLPLVAHNAAFDVGFIRHNARKIGMKLTNPVIDTLQMSRVLFHELKRHKLDVVAKHLGIKLENHHRAVNDSIACAGIFSKCMEILKEKNVETIDDIQKAFEGNFDISKSKIYHAVILVKNTVGLKNLYKIISDSHLKYFHKKPRVPKKLLMTYREGLILGSACEAGELYSAILEKKSDNEIDAIARFYDYLEIQPLANNQFMINNGKVDSQEELKDINRKIVQLGDKYNKPVVATCDVHFLDPIDEAFRRILMSGQGFTDADNQAPLYLRTTDEMLKEFMYLGEEKCFDVVVTNTNKIADMVEVIAPVPEGTFPPKMEGAEEEIKRLSETKAKEMYGEPLPEIVKQRLDKELNSIIKNGFAVMYLIAQKLVFKSLSDGYLVGSRGSVGSSFVANMAGITEVNSLEPHYICTNSECRFSEFFTDGSYECGFDLPEKSCPKCGQPLQKDGYDIPFETFLGFDGDKEPDIDLNFSGEYQAKAHKYTEELFGEGHVFRAGTIATVADKTAYGFVKNYLDERNNIVTNAEINRLVCGCTGIKRTTGQHPGGIMIVPQDKEIYDFSPIQRPADDTQSNIITTHFDYHFLHGSILKLDILGHDDPTAIRMLEDITGVNAREIPIGEKHTMGIFSSTSPLGVKPEDINSEVGTFAIPEFGTKFVRQMLVDTKPSTFSELIRISGLSHGTDVWLNNAQELIRAGTCNLSQSICCRDDIMIYLIHAGLPPKTAFKIMEDVRKGKGLREEYIECMKENKVPNWYIDSCNKIKYMFPKAHAAAYVMMAFRIAWFKVNYPEAFYVTYFTVRADDFDATLMTRGQDRVRNAIKELEAKGNEISTKEKSVLTILEVTNEMYARGIKFLPIDIYKSDAIKFQITPSGILPPLNALQGLGTAAAQNMVEARKGEPFGSIDELRIRAKISKAVVEMLQKNGCLNGMHESNQVSLF